MVTLGLRQTTEEANEALEEKLRQQVVEIVEASHIEEEPAQEPAPRPPAWNFSMPFAGVRYFTYD
ncbi:MAG: hypothetical protein OXE17_01945 [Chloroflexi bacterium]|nr:hypothetical protein [Chloroflexota bacterium]